MRQNIVHQIYFLISILLLSFSSKAQDTTHALQEVVITGQYAPQSLKNSVYKVRVINQERIALQGVTSVLNVLNNELGIRLSTDNTLGETDVQLMGVSGQRIKVLLDGVPLIDRDATKQSLAQIDINQIERIEIVDGPMSTVYGTDALGGVINLITKKNKLRNNLTITARIQEESVGSYYDPFSKNGIHNENIGINWQKNKWRVNAYGTRNNFGGFTDTAAYPSKYVKPKDQWLTGATIGYNLKHLNIWYRLDYLHENLFAAGPMSLNTGKALDQYYITNRYTHILQADWDVKNNFKVNTSLSYQDYKRNTESYAIDYVNNTNIVAVGDGYWDVTSFNSMFFRSTAQWIITSKLSLQPGVEIKRDETTGQRIKLGSPAITDYSLFASAEYKPIESISIKPGLRFSKNSQYDAPPLIPSINTKIAINKNVDVRLSYAHGFRAPILRELYFNFFDANHSLEGNPDLKAEYSDSYMASVSWNNSTKNIVQINSSLSGFYNNYTNFITTAVKTGTTISSYFNLAKYKTTGATFENKLNYKNISATLGFSYIARYNQLKEDDNTLPTFNWSPEINSNIIYRFTKLKGELGLFYKFTGQTPSYSTDNNGIYLAKISSYHWADLTASKQVNKYISLQGGVKNIFNVGRIASTLQSGGAHSSGGAILTGYGRSYFIGINLKWSKQ